MANSFICYNYIYLCVHFICETVDPYDLFLPVSVGSLSVKIKRKSMISYDDFQDKQPSPLG